MGLKHSRGYLVHDFWYKSVQQLLPYWLVVKFMLLVKTMEVSEHF